ncbi:MAG TPA: leucine--tRNA ligase [Candidatus Limnocylindria bacterium]|nr:leucine--tRNA ligase [Candidatus Limnocylindria bacterium]
MTASERPERLDPSTYEAKWRERWERDELYRAHDDASGPFYLLTMFPYTSGDVHIGHWYASTGPDVLARMHRMRGEQVMLPMGFDSFGLPAENAAIDRGIHPADWTYPNIERMRTQFRSMGASWDWSREVVTSDPEYYRWTQWLFLQFYKAGLAYKAMAPVDWCPKDQVVLAREQVLGADRRCWRCDTPVIKRDLEQWFFRITKYADELLDFSGMDWPEPILLMQRNWIGRSEGAEIDFPVAPLGSASGTDPDGLEPIRVFTTRPDTIFGATFMVLAPEHALVPRLTTDDRRAEVEAYVAAARRETEIDRLAAERERTGMFTGAYAVNPLTDEPVPIWIADYVLPGYGTGAIMGVPAHDERDYDFARRYDLPIEVVVAPRGEEPPTDAAFTAHTDDEVLVNSGEFTGMSAAEGIAAITAHLAERGLGGPAVTYKIRDWLVSRQRYWGAPIPIVYCEVHGAQPVPESELPVLLPRDVDFASTGVSPLQSHEGFLAATCPVGGEPARRETDTMDTFVDSSWYYLRYTSPRNADAAWDREAMRHWLPVNLYTGGAEHAVLHLLYSRFFVKALRDMGHVAFNEPFVALRNQGQILGADHQRMSKSRGNVVNPDDLVARYGADTIRLFLLFIGPWDQGGPWSPTGIEGVSRFLARVWNLAQPSAPNATGATPTLSVPGMPPRSIAGEIPGSGGTSADELLAAIEGGDRALRRATHQTIAAVTEDYGELHFNTAISKLMELSNAIADALTRGASRAAVEEAVDTLLLLLAPAAPHIAEELWERRGKPYSVHQQAWPVADRALAAADLIELPVQVDGKLRDRLQVAPETSAEEIERLALASERVQAYLDGRPPARVVQIPGRLVNIVTKGS